MGADSQGFEGPEGNHGQFQSPADPGMLSSMNHRQARLILSTALVTATLTGGCKTINQDWVDARKIQASQARDWVTKNPGNYLLVDARPALAHETVRIPGSVRIDTSEIDPNDRDPRFERYKAVIVYGENPAYGRADALTKRFGEADIKVYMIDGGLKSWQQAGFDIERPNPTPAATPTNP